MKKRFLAMALTLCMVITLCSVQVFAGVTPVDPKDPADGYYLVEEYRYYVDSGTQYDHMDYTYSFHPNGTVAHKTGTGYKSVDSTYDENGNCVTETIIYENSNNYKDVYRYTYDASGKITLLEKESYYKDSDMYTKSYPYTYDEKGNLLSTDGYNFYTYDSNGRRTTRTSGLGNSREVTAQYIYDSNGYLITALYKTYTGDARSEYVNDANGRCVKETYYDPDGTVGSVFEYKYDEHGNNVEITTNYSNSSRTTVYVYRYENLTSQETPATPSTPATNPTVGGFSDVKESDYFADPVVWAVENNITTGTSSTTFSPNASCTRAQAVTFLWRTAGEPEPEGTGAKFSDVPSGQYYSKAVQWAVENGVTTGATETTFDPNGECSRAQIVTFLYRLAEQPEVAGEHGFSDVSGEAYYENAVKWAVRNGITTGTSGTTFSPNNTCTRAQIVTFLYRDLA